jgi:hypothetical protein
MFFTNNLQADGTFGNIGSGIIGGINAAVVPAPSSGINWNSIINRAFDLGSQFMQSYGNATVGTQTYGSGGQIFAVNPQPQTQQYPAYVPTGGGQVQGGSVGNTVGSGLDGILSFVMTPIGLIVVGGAILLFMRPPGRK